VWIAPADTLAGWRPAFADAVRGAFAEWDRLGLPVHFAVGDDSTAADVRVRWVDSLPGSAAGVTDWRSDRHARLQSAVVRIAMRASDGRPQDVRGVRAIALHEIGHLLGLGHSPNDDDIMAPWVTADALSARDRATAALLYELPPGRVR
jgi:predicted Zn-dependent protease